MAKTVLMVGMTRTTTSKWEVNCFGCIRTNAALNLMTQAKIKLGEIE